MAELTETNSSAAGDDLPLAGLTDNPLLRQLAVMVGIAASVALGVAVVLWSQTPNMAPLYGNMGQKDAAEVVAALEQAGIPFRLDESTGMVMVPSADVQKLRMQLASQGLPNTTGTGYEILQQESGFGTSRMVEQARYHHAIESELARTISTLTGVESARVHLALPKQSVFVRKRKMPSASVVLKLFAGRRLEQPQVDSIVHLVAASIPELEAGRVTVVDHKGRLLSERSSDRNMKLSSTQFEYTQKIESHYRDRVVDILAPILGADSIQAQVTADIDFTVTEQTQERFNPDQPALRSEQVSEQLSNASGGIQGVPGALSNQPPTPGTAPQDATAGGADGAASQARNSNKNATRNYELDRVVSHTRQSPASIRRLSVAVVVDDVLSAGADGAVVRRERTPEEIERITQLVQEAVGFDARRGDSVKVINSAFHVPAPMEALPEPPLWEQTWVWDLAKQVGGALVVLLLIFGVLRPTLKKLTTTTVAELPEGAAMAGAAGGAVPVGGAGEGTPALTADGKSVQLTGPASYEETMDAARKLVDNDPKRVAQLVKTWVAEDAG